jgi:Secretion system C-terminal sorting domain
MKRIITSIGIGLTVLLIFVVLIKQHSVYQTDKSPSILIPEGFDMSPKAKKDGINVYEDFLQKARANQITGTVDMKDVIKAQEETFKMRELAKKRRAGTLNLEWQFMGPDNMGGRTRGILYDKDNPQRVYSGGVSGGLWYSNDGATSWIPYDKDDTLAGTGVIDLVQATNGDIYVGTGENFIGTSGTKTYTRGFPGQGVWKSSDGGNTFHQLPSTKPTSVNPGVSWAFVASMGVHPTDANTVLAGTNKGLKISKDAGVTWSNASTSDPVLNTGRIQDVDVANDGTVYAVVAGTLHKGNIDDPASWGSVMGKGGFPSGGFRRLSVAIAPSDENYIYVVGSDIPNAATSGVYRSTDNGVNWSPIAPTTLPSNNFNPAGGQGGYNQDIAVNPIDKDRCYIAGQLNVWTYDDSNKSWWPIARTGNPAFSKQAIHADQHKIVFHPTDPNTMLIATDGGIFKTINANIKYPDLPTYSDNNKGYGVAQFYGITAGLNGDILGGTQDNGPLYLDFSLNSPKQARRLGGVGDGGQSEISKTNPNALFITGNTGGAFGIVLRSSNGGNTSSRFYDNNIDCDNVSNGQCIGDGAPDCGASFIPPIKLWEQTDTSDVNIPFGEGRLFYGIYCGIWMAIDALDFGGGPTWFHVSRDTTGLGSGNLEFVYMEMSGDGDILYAGTTGGEIFRVEGLKNAKYEYDDNGTPDNPLDDFFNPTSAGIKTTRIADLNRYIAEIAVDQKDPNVVVVSLGNYGNTNYVYRATTASTAPASGGLGPFTSIQGNLPKMPVYSCEMDYYNNKNIILGTEMGIFSSSLGGNIWQPEGNGFPSAPVFNIRQELVDNLYDNCYAIYAGTYGRGIYMTKTLTPSSCRVVTGIGEPVINNDQLSVYPNPANYQVTLSFSLTKEEEIQLIVYDLQGKMIDMKDFGILPQGGNTIDYNTQNLSAGTYILLLRSETNQAYSKLMINR